MEKIIYHMGTTSGSENCEEYAPYFVTEFDLDLVNRILGWMDKFEGEGPLKGADKVVLSDDSTQFFLTLDETLDGNYSDGVFHSTHLGSMEVGGLEDIELHITGTWFYWQVYIEYTNEFAESKLLRKSDLLNLLTQLEGTWK
jgi:hypothetical protein